MRKKKILVITLFISIRLFPIIVPNPELTYKMLNARGVDAYMGVTQLDIVESPMGSKYEYPS